MPESVLQRIPVVGGVAYIERLRRLPAAFQARLIVEPGNRYFRHAIAVLGNGEKVGYVAPEVAARYFDGVKAFEGMLTAPARRAAVSDRETSGVELLLDFSSLPVEPAE